jgi:hypothetical protein
MAAAEPRSLKDKTIRNADGTTGHVVSYVRQLSDRGKLRPVASAHQAEESSVSALAAPRQAVSRGRARRAA